MGRRLDAAVTHAHLPRPPFPLIPRTAACPPPPLLIDIAGPIVRRYLCDAFAAATRLECYAPTPSAHHASAAAGKTHASVVTTCKAARSIFASDFMSSFDPRGASPTAAA